MRIGLDTACIYSKAKAQTPRQPLQKGKHAIHVSQVEVPLTLIMMDRKASIGSYMACNRKDADFRDRKVDHYDVM